MSIRYKNNIVLKCIKSFCSNHWWGWSVPQTDGQGEEWEFVAFNPGCRLGKLEGKVVVWVRIC